MERGERKGREGRGREEEKKKGKERKEGKRGEKKEKENEGVKESRKEKKRKKRRSFPSDLGASVRCPPGSPQRSGAARSRRGPRSLSRCAPGAPRSGAQNDERLSAEPSDSTGDAALRCSWARPASWGCVLSSL